MNGTESKMSSNTTAGIYAGLFGGSVFGIMMAGGGMFPMISGMLGMENALVGFVLHMIISAIIGAGFGRALDAMVMQGPGMSLFVGGAYGIVWWVLGPLLIMPLVLGMPVFNVQAMMGSLFGHIMFGITMGTVYYLLRKLPAGN